MRSIIQALRETTAFQKIRVATVTIMLIAAYVSYTHQRELLMVWGVDNTGQYLVPLTVDVLAIVCNIALHVPNLARRGFWTALVVLILAVGVSGSANFISGGTTGAKYANLWTVLAYLLAEFVAAAVKVSDRGKDPKRVAAGKKAASTRKAAGWSVAGVAPQSPAMVSSTQR